MGSFRRIAGLNLLLAAAGLFQTLSIARDLAVTAASTRWMAMFAAWGLWVLVSTALFVLSHRPAGERLAAAAGAFRETRTLPAPAAYFLSALLALLPPLLVLSPLPEPLDQLMGTLAWRAVVFWLAVLAAGAALTLAHREFDFEWLLGVL